MIRSDRIVKTVVDLCKIRLEYVALESLLLNEIEPNTLLISVILQLFKCRVMFVLRY